MSDRSDTAGTPEFEYDVAFSFLSGDLQLAEELAQLLPGLRTFVFSRRKEELLGGNGMDRFGRVFGVATRLAVVLYREGWGQTQWTAFEESHIRSRALKTKLKSFMVVRLDETNTPEWIPDEKLYASTATETQEQIAGIIRARAREQGAVVRSESVSEIAERRLREKQKAMARQIRQESFDAVEEIRGELATIWDEIDRLTAEVRAAVDLDIIVGRMHDGTECAMASDRYSTSLAWRQPIANNLRDARLRVGEWHSRVLVPRGAIGTRGSNWKGSITFAPEVSLNDEWVWRQTWEDDGSALLVVGRSSSDTVYTSKELAEHLVRRHVERITSV